MPATVSANLGALSSRNGDKQVSNNRTRGLNPRWKPGQSGNPKGRPPIGKCLTDELRRVMNEVSPEDAEGRTYLQLLAIATVELAIEGNSTALTMVWNRIDGPVPQTVEEDRRDLPLIQVNWGKGPDEPDTSEDAQTNGHA